MRGKNKSFRGAFTLIELLIVIAIIALLMAIVIPSLAQARETAKRTACLSNLHQIGAAIYTYANENNGVIPFGPQAPPITSSTDFYPCTGSPTSLISLTGGAPVGLGLLLSSNLANTPKALFCPGSDQATDADAQLANVGHQQAQCSYYYRHGSIPDSVPSAASAAALTHIQLANLGYNRNGMPIQALVLDTEFQCSASLALFGVLPSTHHQAKYTNILFSDGHAVTQPNANGQFTVNLNSPAALLVSFDLILQTLEHADGQP